MDHIERTVLGDGRRARDIVKQMIVLGADRHPALIDTGIEVFWGGEFWALFIKGNPVSINCTRIGKRKKNMWEPVANWYSAYTLPSERRKGYATLLYREAEEAALNAGCRRLRALAGSSAGLALHYSLRHSCWGLTEKDEVWVDTALPGFDGFYAGATPPQAPGHLMSNSEIKGLIMKKGLRYDPQT